jgi:sulfite reductase (NADPH) hemoprotein beta-component
MLEIAKVHQGFRLTANQNLIIAGVPAGEKARIEALARQYGLLDDGVSEQRKQSMACVALPTCPGDGRGRAHAACLRHRHRGAAGQARPGG